MIVCQRGMSRNPGRATTVPVVSCCIGGAERVADRSAVAGSEAGVMPETPARECPDPDCVLPDHSYLVAHVNREFLRDSILVYVGELQRVQKTLANSVGSTAVTRLAYLASLQPGPGIEDDVVRGMFALRQFVGVRS